MGWESSDEFCSHGVCLEWYVNMRAPPNASHGQIDLERREFLLAVALLLPQEELVELGV